MQTTDIIAIIAFIILGLTIIAFFGDPRAKYEGFTSLSPADYGPTEQAHLLKDTIESSRPFNTIGTLTSEKCYEQDGKRVIEKVGSYSQRTNNYKHTYPDSCSAPFRELTGSFYTPREGAIGSPVPKDNTIEHITTCAQG